MINSQSNYYNSSTVKASTYNYGHKTLMIHFDHASYLYEGVSVEDYNSFATADSQGRALNEFIKAKYEGVKINEVNQVTAE